MKFKIILLALFCIICLLSSGASVLGYNDTNGTSDVKDQTYVRLLKLDRSISELYAQGNDSHKQAAYKTLQNIKNQLNNIELLQYGTVTAWKQMKQDVLTIEQGIIKNEPNVVWREPISSLLLASDALLQDEHGPWLQYESVLLDDLQSIRRASSFTITDNKKTNAVVAHLTIFKQRVDRMQTAAYMVGDELRMTELIQRTDQLNDFFEESSQVTWTPQQFKEIESAINNIEETIHTLFAQAEETITVPVVSASSGWNPTTLALLIGALISGLLTFTAYRKYKQAPYGVKKV
ncbi:sporulation protein YpjB [Paenibacillus endoradicis]|uniref:sporulation protein YpjB n=1 Tax=Paenibacillus endoradicis TaxID=2972487 RepID=UPI00215920DC|nr:sporulation protein YpjB [Paenibacillus endoradicis]MCR8660268.1 sporulation protein YpjB [Paenibacillus endoradicis]